MSRRATILVVDDTAQNVALLDELLRDEYRVKVALSGEKALAAIGRQPPDLILLDVMMPGMDGYEVCRRLKENPLTRHIPVIFITARSEVADEQLGFALGAVDYITKPISPPLVQARIRNHLALLDHRVALEQQVQVRTQELARANNALTQEIGLRQRAMEHAEYLFNFDQATGLPNRRQFVDRLERAVTRARQDGTQLAVIGFSLDRFNLIKTTLGGAMGDQLLVQAARRLQNCCRSTDLLARTGGDEFALLLASSMAQDEGALAREAEGIAARAIEMLAETHELANGRADVTASAAYALFPAECEDAVELLRRTEATLEHLKMLGGNHFRRYDNLIDSSIATSFVLETRLREAIRTGGLVPYYQPKLSLVSGRVVGAEALLRWPLENGSFVSPADFIPVAERAGLVGQIDRFVMDASCAQIAAWTQQFGDLGEFRLAVNMSAAAFQNPDLGTELAAALQRHGVAAHHLELEITEHALIADLGDAVEKLNAIRQMGVRIALDDFGTGYSSMSYLRRLPIDLLKVDQTFVRDIDTDRNAAAIVRAIIQMGHSLDQEVVAEGVETLEQLAFLEAHSCNSVQGWLFSPAVPAEAMGEIYRKGVLQPTVPGRRIGRA